MKKERKKDGKMVLIFFVSMFVILLIMSMVSAGWWEEVRAKITGRATSQTVSLNISVGGPQITAVFNNSPSIVSIGSGGPDEAPSSTGVIINFTAYSPSGAGNLNDSTALVNVTGDTTRTNSSCTRYESTGDYANYTCNVIMWWWDGTGTWSITAYIEDNQTNSATNTSMDFSVGERTAFAMSPSSLAWSGISPSSTNQTSNNDPLLLNNTGNDVIAAASIAINSSNLRGETIPAQALWAGNFSVSWETGGSCSGTACTECGGTVMNRNAYQGVATANLTKGNYTVNDGDTGQEELYFCLKLAGSELSTQAYSTANATEWNWIVQIS